MNLYPPIIDTYMPAFVPSLADNKVNIYFSLSKFNSPTEIKGVWVSLTDPQTNKPLINSKTDLRLFEFDEKSNKDPNRDGDDKYYITLTNADLKTGKWEINKTYKVQIRFSSVVPTEGQEGMDWIVTYPEYFSEWSTVILARGTSYSGIVLNNFPEDSTTILNNTSVRVVGKLEFENKLLRE